MWKRLTDHQGNAKSCGICVYLNIEGMLKCLRLLNNLKIEEGYELSVKVNNEAEEYLKIWREMKKQEWIEKRNLSGTPVDMNDLMKKEKNGQPLEWELELISKDFETRIEIESLINGRLNGLINFENNDISNSNNTNFYSNDNLNHEPFNDFNDKKQEQIFEKKVTYITTNNNEFRETFVNHEETLSKLYNEKTFRYKEREAMRKNLFSRIENKYYEELKKLERREEERRKYYENIDDQIIKLNDKKNLIIQEIMKGELKTLKREKSKNNFNVSIKEYDAKLRLKTTKNSNENDFISTYFEKFNLNRNNIVNDSFEKMNSVETYNTKNDVKNKFEISQNENCLIMDLKENNLGENFKKDFKSNDEDIDDIDGEVTEISKTNVCINEIVVEETFINNDIMDNKTKNDFLKRKIKKVNVDNEIVESSKSNNLMESLLNEVKMGNEQVEMVNQYEIAKKEILNKQEQEKKKYERGKGEIDLVKLQIELFKQIPKDEEELFKFKFEWDLLFNVRYNFHYRKIF
jgi:hypothetical protein